MAPLITVAFTRGIPIRFEKFIVFVIFEFCKLVQVKILETILFGLLDCLVQGFFKLLCLIGLLGG